MKPIVECFLPLSEDSKVTFILSDTTKYSGIVKKSICHKDKYFIRVNELFSNKNAVNDIFKAFFGIGYIGVLEKLNINAIFEGAWPRTSLEDLEIILRIMKGECTNVGVSQSKPSLDFSKFRFRIGDDILYDGEVHKIVGYFFGNGFNNFKDSYGYVINNKDFGHDGSVSSYDEQGNEITFKGTQDKWNINEYTAEKITIKQNENENQLQREEVGIRGQSPRPGCAVCNRKHKARIAVKSLSYKTFFGKS